MILVLDKNGAEEHGSPGLIVFTPSTLSNASPKDLHTPLATNLAMVLEEDKNSPLMPVVMDFDEWPFRIRDSPVYSYGATPGILEKSRLSDQ